MTMVYISLSIQFVLLTKEQPIMQVANSYIWQTRSAQNKHYDKSHIVLIV